MGKESRKGIKGMEVGGQGSHKDRWGEKGDFWGDNSSSRATTKAYRDGWDRIFKGAEEEAGEEFVEVFVEEPVEGSS